MNSAPRFPTSQRPLPSRLILPDTMQPLLVEPERQSEDADNLPENPRWSHGYALFRRLRLVGRKPQKTIDGCDEVDRLWRQYVGNPYLVDLTETILKRFSEALAQRRWRGKVIAATTQTKHLKTLQSMLRYFGPRTGKKRTAARIGLFGCAPDTRIPWPAPMLSEDDWPKITTVTRPDLERRDLTEWLDCCAESVKPEIHGIDSPQWWCDLLIFLRNTGLRIETALLSEWAWLDGHWLHCPPEAVKGKKHGFTIYVNSMAMGAALRSRTENSRIFSWNWSRSWFCGLCEVAGRVGWLRVDRAEQKRPAYWRKDRKTVLLPPKWRPHALRRTLLSELDSVNHTAAQFQAGHLHGDVMRRYYSQARKILPGLLEDTKLLWQPDPKLVKLAEPRFVSSLPSRDDRQQRFF